jgi:hypothetical protein
VKSPHPEAFLLCSGTICRLQIPRLEAISLAAEEVVGRRSDVPETSATSHDVQINDPRFKIFGVRGPCLAINAWGGVLLEVEETCL